MARAIQAFERFPVQFVKEAEDAQNLSSEKECTDHAVLIGVQDGLMVEMARAVWWMGRSAGASRVYCTIWAHGPSWVHARHSGHGYAGGYGYCKMSAAFESALRSAGIQVLVRETEDGEATPFHPGGAGRGAVRDALLALGRHWMPKATDLAIIGTI